MIVVYSLILSFSLHSLYFRLYTMLSQTIGVCVFFFRSVLSIAFRVLVMALKFDELVEPYKSGRV